MPYENEFADKTSHVDIIKNPDVSEFLSKCHKIEYDTQVRPAAVSEGAAQTGFCVSVRRSFQPR